MNEQLKIARYFVLLLLFVLVLSMLGYFALACNDAALKGGFIATAIYLIKKFADEIEEVIDYIMNIKNSQGEGK